MKKYFKSFGLYAIVFAIILGAVAYTGPGMLGKNTETAATEAYDYGDLIKELDVYKDGKIVYFIQNANVWYTATGGIQALDVMLNDLEETLLQEEK